MAGLQRGLWFIVTCWLLCALPTGAQDTATGDARDPASLARRLRGWDGATALPDLAPIYRPGDTLEFWAGKLDGEQPARIRATLAASAPSVYLWVEDGLDYSPQAMQQAAQALDNLFKLVRWRGTYRSPGARAAADGQAFDPTDLYAVTDVDADPHLYIVYTTGLPDDREAIYNPVDSLPAWLAPGPYTNQHEVLFVNTSPYVGAQPSDGIFISTLFRAFYNLVTDANQPGQPPWLREALSWYLLYQFQQTPVTSAEAGGFLGDPATMLLHPSTLTTRSPALGAQLLFLSYLEQRYGAAVMQRLYRGQGNGMAAVDAALAAAEVVDPATGAPVTAEMVFADFVLTNAINRAFGDGRYVYRAVQLSPAQLAAATPLENSRASVTEAGAPQFGTRYFSFDARQPVVLSVGFSGEETARRLDMPATTGADDHFYWSGRGGNRDAMLTRHFDLSTVQTATLTFDAWYDLATGWDYGYVEVSANDGVTWEIVPATSAGTLNRNGAAYGPGYTGISNLQRPRPFPVMGVLMSPDGVTISGVPPGGPAAAAGLQPGDLIIGYDEHPWPGTPNLLGLLGDYAPGDTLSLWIQRGGQRLSVPVLLGAHESRVIEPTPHWLAQEADLTPYAGQDILLRFEVVTLPNHQSEGLAIDNIAIPEIDFADSGDGGDDDWTMTGWQRVTNHVPARYLVQLAAFGSGQPARARSVLLPGEGVGGEWRIDLNANDRLIIAISGMNEDTFQPAGFDLEIAPAG